jgi:DNA-binding NarL/FixJ family response regulator
MNENVDCLLKDRPPGNILRITPWERDALQLLADGHTRNKLSRYFGLSASVIDFRLEELFASMGAATQTEAIAVARKRGLLRPEPETGQDDLGIDNWN